MKTTTPKETRAMAETKAHADWQKENTTKVFARLNRNTDADILAYLEGKSQAAEIKRALRIMIALENQKPLPK